MRIAPPDHGVGEAMSALRSAYALAVEAIEPSAA
jgi:hypothetical protein